MEVFINEQSYIEDKISIFEARQKYKSDADVIILNGHLMDQDKELEDNDRLVLIKKGENFTKEELENFIVARHTPGVHQILKKSCVAIAGLGGLGSNVATSLCRMGIGKLIICDFDIVEPSNINRQAYFLRHIGMKKTKALKEILKDINPYVEVVEIDEFLDQNNMVDFCKEASIVVEAFDKARYKGLLSKIILEESDKILITGSGLSGFYSSNTIMTKKLGKRFYVVGDLNSEAKPKDGLMAPRVLIASNHQANMVVRILMGEESP